ncbi:hypothetical protein V8D89_001922 [Ganoderma adspersum]
MVVDLRMPLNGAGDDSDPSSLPRPDIKDQFLLGGPAIVPILGAGPSSGTLTTLINYLSGDGSMRPSKTNDMAIDVSRDAQLRDIDTSFAAIESSEFSALRHPIQPELAAVEVFEIFPGADTWANAPPDHLSNEDEATLEFKRGRMAHDQVEDAPDGDEPTYFHFVRDYETFKVKQQMPNEFLLVLDEGTDEFETDVRGGALPPKRAYYKNIERKMLLKKKRVNTYESYGDKWDVVKQGGRAGREEALAEVTDPLFPLARADADADADGEVDDTAFGLNATSTETANAIRQETINVLVN